MSLPDDQLVTIARRSPEGDLRAFDALVLRHQERILTNCRYLTRSADEAPDLAQEVFVKAFFGLKGFEGRAAFGTWIQRIKVNHCLNHLQKKRGSTAVEIDDPAMRDAPELSVPPEAERLLEERADRRLIAAILDSLPETLRVPLIMCDLDGFSYQEIAEDLGIGLSAVKMRIKRGREEFRRRFAAAAGEPLAETG